MNRIVELAPALLSSALEDYEQQPFRGGEMP